MPTGMGECRAPAGRCRHDADIAKVNIFLPSRDYRAANTAIRHEVLRGHSPAITIVIADIFDEAWLLEIDVIACA